MPGDHAAAGVAGEQRAGERSVTVLVGEADGADLDAAEDATEEDHERHDAAPCREPTAGIGRRCRCAAPRAARWRAARSARTSPISSRTRAAISPACSRDLGREHGDEQRPDDEDDLVEHRLEGVGRLQPRVPPRARGPTGPAPATRSTVRTSRQRPRVTNSVQVGASLRREHDEGDQPDAVQRHRRQQHPALPEPVDEPGDGRRRERVDEREDRRDAPARP